MKRAERGLPVVARFISKVKPSEGGCWEWEGAHMGNGYGALRIKRKTRLAHRLAWQFMRGPIPVGLCVLHTCDNRSCVNPDHLFLGTIADNSKDMAAKGRATSKLTAEDVIKIRSLFGTMPQRLIAESFGISHGSVHGIAYGTTWSHVPGAIRRPGTK